MNPLIVGEGLVVDVPAKRVLDGITIGLGEGDRVGVVGRNGDGKSTLLAALARRRELDDGRVTWRRDLRVGFLDQADVLPDDATVGILVAGDRADHEWAGDARIRDIVDGLLGDIGWHATVGSLSGGQRRRTALAALLAGEWDVLFLDEPNNSMGCSFRTPRFYRRGRATSRPDTRRRARGRRSVVPCRTVPVGRGGR